MKERTEKIRYIYEQAKTYLYKIAPIEKEELEKYFVVQKEYKTKNDILLGILKSLQNNTMMPNVIGFNKSSKTHIFKDILFNYDSSKILSKYDKYTLLETFSHNFIIRNIESKGNLWKRYSQSIISACSFVNRFESVEDFDSFVKSFNYNELSSAALPMLLEKEIYGFGFPLACDFLKELGYSEYPKPDTHIKDMLNAFVLCDYDDYSVYKTVIEMAKIVNETPYKVDKIFWLIGSGKYYLHEVEITSHKQQFISSLKSDLF